MSRHSFAPGKIILSGEYAVLYGFAGIAVPSAAGVEVVFEEDPARTQTEIHWEEARGNQQLLNYATKVVAFCEKRIKSRGRLTIHSDVPLGKGMGSSTALIAAIVRTLLGDGAREAALDIEDALNPGHSGLDFAVVWASAPVLFRKGILPVPIDLSLDVLQEATLIDTGLPNESTTELVAWVRSRGSEIQEPLKTIGNCTDRLVQGEPLGPVMRAHNRAQIELGVVPPDVQELIAAIERIGGSAKVIGAGGRTGKAGMVLAFGNREEIQKIADQRNMPAMSF